MARMSIQAQVLLRHRSEGHLRFALPAALLAPEPGERLVAGLRAMEGIYRVDLHARQGKLSIRYLPVVCDFGAVIRHFHALLNELAGKIAGGEPRVPSGSGRRQIAFEEQQPSGAGDWLRDKLQEGRETLTAMGILLSRGVKAIAQRPRWVTEFLNDLLMLYLIKLHWHNILYSWLPNPWRYRYEWMATFYLIHLSVQSRLPPRTEAPAR